MLAPNAPLLMEPESEPAETIRARMQRSKLITGTKGRIKLTSLLHDSLALFDDGTLYVVRGQQNNNHVVSFIEGQRMMGTRILRVSPVSFRQLQSIYNEAGEAGRGERDDKDSADKQKEFLEIIRRAALLGASDIHLTLWPTSMSVEFRVDGVIEKTGEMGYQDGRALLIAAYNMADSSGVSHQMLHYQEARISSLSASLPSTLQALRLQFNPLVFRGRLLIIRLLYAETAQTIKHLGDLGWTQTQQKSLRQARQKATGLIIISGPTGAGKSTTLKIMLEALKQEGTNGPYKERHILTVEDPPEYVIDDVHQMPVPEAESREARDFEMSKAINAALRSDPDTIIIGEIRDRESAKLAFAATMSGHQVWTTLHANSAAAIIPRLRDIGVEPYKIADPENIAALISQRLVRLLCRHCRIPLLQALKQPHHLHPAYARMKPETLPATLEALACNPETIFLAAKGCSKCRNGHAGRAIIGEIILPTMEFLELAVQGKMTEAQQLWREEKSGHGFKQHAIERLAAGEIDPVEFERWCGALRDYSNSKVRPYAKRN